MKRVYSIPRRALRQSVETLNMSTGAECGKTPKGHAQLYPLCASGEKQPLEEKTANAVGTDRGAQYPCLEAAVG